MRYGLRVREWLGVILVVLGLAAFTLALVSIYVRRLFIEAGLTFLCGWITMAAGIRLLKLTAAARILLRESEPRGDEPRSPR